MKAMQVHTLGEELAMVDIPVPRPAAGEALVKIAACGLNFADMLMQTGEYQEKPDLPFTLGMEVAGIVAELGPDVSGLKVGDRVAVFSGQGGLAEYGVFPADRCVVLPDAMSLEQAAAFQVAYGTSHLALTRRAQLQPGETLLVMGAAGGVGLTAVEIGKAMGAKVIAVARGAEKMAVAQRAGADHVFDSTRDDLHRAVRSLGGADVVYDPVGGDLFTMGLKCCNPEARVLVIGFASGKVAPVPANILLVKNISVIGYYWGGYMAFAPLVLSKSLAELFTWYRDDRLRPHISHVLPMDRASEGLDLLRSRKSTGKVVIGIA